MPFFITELGVWVVRTRRLNRFQSNRRGKQFGLKHTIGLADGCFIRQNPIGHAINHRIRPAILSICNGSTFVGVLSAFAIIDPVKALFLDSGCYWLLAPFLLVGILMAASNQIMNGQTSSILSRAVVAIATLVMFGAAIGMFVF